MKIGNSTNKLHYSKKKKIWRDRHKRIRGTLNLNQELESLVNEVKVGGWTSLSIMAVWKDGMVHLFESLQSVSTGVPGRKCC